MENLTAVWIVSILTIYFLIYNQGYRIIGATLFMITGLTAFYVSNTAVGMAFSLITIIIWVEAIISNTTLFPRQRRR